MDSSTRKHHLEAQESSGETITAYCAHHDLNPLTFYKWRSEARKRTNSRHQDMSKLSSTSFRELTIPPMKRSNRVLEYQISTVGLGFTLTIPSGFAAEEVSALLSLLSAKEAGC